MSLPVIKVKKVGRKPTYYFVKAEIINNVLNEQAGHGFVCDSEGTTTKPN